MGFRTLKPNHKAGRQLCHHLVQPSWFRLRDFRWPDSRATSCWSFYSALLPPPPSPAIPLYFSFSKLCDLSVWGHERLITSVWTGLTVGRPCESFSHTLVPAGLGPGLYTAVILSSSGPLWSQSDPPWQTEPRFWERERERDPGDPATQLVTEPALDVFTFILKLVSDQTCWNLTKLTL